MKRSLIFVLAIFLLLVSISLFSPNVSALSYEDFTTYTEYDPDDLLSQTTTRATWTNVERQDTCYLYKNRGTNYFSGSFDHMFDVNVTALEGGDADSRLFILVWSLSNVPGTSYDLPNYSLLVRLKQNGNSDTQYVFNLNEKGGTDLDGTYLCSVNTAYYVRVKRIGTTFSCDVYGSTSDRLTETNVLEHLSITESSAYAFGYIQTSTAIEATSDPTDWSSGYVENLLLNFFPTNDYCDLEDADIGTQGCLAQKKAYTFRVKVTDNDGGTDINYVQIHLHPIGINIQYRWTETTDYFSEEWDPNGYCTIWSTSADSTLTGNQWTLDFKLKFDWDYPDENLRNIRVYVIDDQGATDDDTYSSVYYVENDLILSTSSWINDDRGDISQSLTASATLYYQGTTIYPPDAQITQVQVHDPSHTVEGSGTTTSGVFSIGYTAKATVTTTTYHIYINGAGDYSDGDITGQDDTFITDRVNVTITADDTLVYANTQVNFTVTAIYEYDSLPVTSWTVNINRNGSHFASGNYTDTQTIAIIYQYTTENITETTYGLTAFQSNTVTVEWEWNYFNLNLQTRNMDGNILTLAWVYMNNGTQYSQQVTSQGWANWTSVRQNLNVSVYATWYGITVNSTYVIMNSDKTLNLTCLVYPFNAGAQLVASNATISSVSYASSILTTSFSGSVNTYKLVVTGSRPTYIMNVSYDLATDYTSLLNLTHYGNATIRVSWESWGDTYIQRVDHRLTTVSWSEQKLRMYMDGPSSQIGTLKIYCGSRGNPQTNFGFTATSYASQVFTGTYQFTSQVYCWVDWATEEGGGETGGGGEGISRLLVDFPIQVLPVIFVDEPNTVTLTFVFDRSTLIFLESVEFGQYPDWFTVEEGLPLRIIKVEEGEQTVEVQVIVHVPSGSQTGPYRIPCVLTIRDSSTIHTINSYLEFSVAAPAGVPDYMTIFFISLFCVFFAGTVFTTMRKRRRSYRG